MFLIVYPRFRIVWPQFSGQMVPQSSRASWGANSSKLISPLLSSSKSCNWWFQHDRSNRWRHNSTSTHDEQLNMCHGHPASTARFYSQYSQCWEMVNPLPGTCIPQGFSIMGWLNINTHHISQGGPSIAKLLCNSNNHGSRQFYRKWRL